MPRKQPESDLTVTENHIIDFINHRDHIINICISIPPTISKLKMSYLTRKL